MHALLRIVIILLLYQASNVQTTIDLNIRELQYIAYELTFTECKLLSEALQKQSWFLEEPLSGHGQLANNETCLNMLVRWDRTAGKGKTFNDLSRRLRQIGRGDIAARLSKNVYHEESLALHENFLDDPFRAKIATDSILLDNDKTESKLTATHENIDTDSNHVWQILIIISVSISILILAIVSFRRCCTGWFCTTWRQLTSDDLVELCDLCGGEVTLCWKRFLRHYDEIVIGKAKTDYEGSLDVEYCIKMNLLDDEATEEIKSIVSSNMSENNENSDYFNDSLHRELVN